MILPSSRPRALSAAQFDANEVAADSPDLCTTDASFPARARHGWYPPPRWSRVVASGRRAFMGTNVFNRAGRGVFAVAGGIMLACAASPEAIAQSCYNNSNPNLVQNGDFEAGSVGSAIPHWRVRWSATADPYVNVGNDNP